jgi:ribosomal protein S18 acetylase RimI-like enzyme
MCQFQIGSARLPDETALLRRMMADYLTEFDSASDPDVLWDDAYYGACSAGLRAGTHAILFARVPADDDSPGPGDRCAADCAAGFVIARSEPLWYRPGVLLGHIEELYVRPSFRRRAAGTQLVGAACEALRRHGTRTVTASVLHENRERIAFWDKVGFELKVYQLYRYT